MVTTDKSRIRNDIQKKSTIKKSKRSKRKTKKVNFFNKKAPMNLRERKYCSCLVKVRGKYRYQKPFQAPYGICTKSVYWTREQERGLVDCLDNYNFNKFTRIQLQALVKENRHIKLTQDRRYKRKAVLIEDLQKYVESRKPPKSRTKSQTKSQTKSKTKSQTKAKDKAK